MNQTEKNDRISSTEVDRRSLWVGGSIFFIFGVMGLFQNIFELKNIILPVVFVLFGAFLFFLAYCSRRNEKTD